MQGAFFTAGFTLLTGLCAAFVGSASCFPFFARCASRRRPAHPECVYIYKAYHHFNAKDGAELMETEVLVRVVAPPLAWAAFQAVYVAAMLLMAVSSIHVVARSVDDLCILFFGDAVGLVLLPPSAAGFVRSCPARDSCAGVEAFAAVDSAGGFIITSGYLLTALMSIPFCALDIVDWAQGAMFSLSLLCAAEMMAEFARIAASLPPRAPPRAWAPAGAGALTTTSFLAWCVSFAVPMWLDQTADGVAVNAAVWSAHATRGALFAAFATTAAAAFPGLHTLNVLDVLRFTPGVHPRTVVAGFLFAVTSVLPNIVAHSMAVKRTLVVHAGPRASTFLGVVLPWLLAWTVYFGAAYACMVNACSVFLNGSIQFALPAALFIALSRFSAATNLEVGGLRLPADAWHSVATGVVLLVLCLVLLAYGLDALAAAGVYPRRAGRVPDPPAGTDYAAPASYNVSAPAATTA